MNKRNSELAQNPLPGPQTVDITPLVTLVREIFPQLATVHSSGAFKQQDASECLVSLQKSLAATLQVGLSSFLLDEVVPGTSAVRQSTLLLHHEYQSSSRGSMSCAKSTI